MAMKKIIELTIQLNHYENKVIITLHLLRFNVLKAEKTENRNIHKCKAECVWLCYSMLHNHCLIMLLTTNQMYECVLYTYVGVKINNSNKKKTIFGNTLSLTTLYL